MKPAAVGIDPGDRISHWCAFNDAGEVIERGRVRTTAEAIAEQARSWRGARVAIENGTHSGWIGRALSASSVSSLRVLTAQPDAALPLLGTVSGTKTALPPPPVPSSEPNQPTPPKRRCPGQVHPTASSVSPLRVLTVQPDAALPLLGTVSGTKTALPPPPCAQAPPNPNGEVTVVTSLPAEPRASSL